MRQVVDPLLTRDQVLREIQHQAELIRESLPTQTLIDLRNASQAEDGTSTPGMVITVDSNLIYRLGVLMEELDTLTNILGRLKLTLADVCGGLEAGRLGPPADVLQV
jgi:hypothetical protein